MKPNDLPLCGWCEEPVFDAVKWIPHLMPNGPTKTAYHTECLVRSIMGGLHHQMGDCNCCGGQLDPDPPKLSKREAARAAYKYFQEKEDALYEVARKVCGEFGVEWVDPRRKGGTSQ